MLRELRKLKRARSTLTVLRETSTPRFRTEPMLRSWLLYPEVDGSGMLRSRSLVVDRYASKVSSTRFWSSAASTPPLSWVSFSHFRSRWGMSVDGEGAENSCLPNQSHEV